MSAAPLLLDLLAECADGSSEGGCLGVEVGGDFWVFLNPPRPRAVGVLVAESGDPLPPPLQQWTNVSPLPTFGVGF